MNDPRSMQDETHLMGLRNRAWADAMDIRARIQCFAEAPSADMDPDVALFCVNVVARELAFRAHEKSKLEPAHE